MGRHREPSRGRSAALRDLLLILAAVFALVGLGLPSGLFDRVYRWIDQRFEADLGNALAVLVLLCVGLAAFASLQWRSARRESEARRGVENRFRTLVERVPAVTYTWDSSKHAGEVPAAYISPQIEALLGYPPEEFQHDPKLWSSLVHPDDLERVLRDWKTADETDGTVLSEYRMRTRDGQQVWVRDEAVPVSRHDKHPLLQGVMFDITERKLAEERLLEAEERFRSLVEQIPAITYIQDPDGRFLYTSPQIESVLGYTALEWMSDPSFWKQQLHPDDHDRVLAEDEAVAGDEWTSSYRMIARDGRVVWLLDHTALLRDSEGAPRYWQGVAFDITELKTAEDRITEAETSYRTLVEQLPVVVYRDAIDDVSTAIYISPQYEQLFGFPAEARMRDPEFWVDHLHPDDRDRIVELSRWTNETGEPFSAEYRFLAREGRVVWVRDEAVLLRDPDGKPLMWQGVLLDVTARKHAEEALSRRDTVLEAIGFAAERFLKSHEWSSALPEVLERIGTAAAASRVYVYENETLEDGRLAMSLRCEWLAPEIASIDIPANQRFPYADGFVRWQSVLSGGMELHGLTRNFPEAERAALKAEAVLSQIVVPVFDGDEWWGFLGFDDCLAERVWPPAEVEALKAAADTLGSAIGRTRAEQERSAAQQQLEETQERY
ncbi:MAG: PAS domain-containing protein, partial [Actinomycetota bacterium]